MWSLLKRYTTASRVITAGLPYSPLFKAHLVKCVLTSTTIGVR
ncbi:hypothetical protein [Vibrio phage 33Fb.4]|nr:hypothetical protein [Vibrio phage 31Fb.4]WAG58467.1 hypothetical protein [Vibrio phage 33Fb.4]